MTEQKSTKGQQTREGLIEAALHQFAANGYHGTSMRQIAEAAGLAVGGIYNHFASKEEILKAVILQYHPLNVVGPELAGAQGASFEELLHDTAHRFYAAIRAQPELLNVFFIELVECKGQHLPELFETLFPKVEHFARRLASLDVRLRPLPPFAVIRIFFSMMMGFFLTETLFAKMPAMPTTVGNLDDFLDVFMHGLLVMSDE
ncbi:MAG: TetR/AcrR family transcriptional regulator [Caldilineaceae bacterium]